MKKTKGKFTKVSELDATLSDKEAEEIDKYVLGKMRKPGTVGIPISFTFPHNPPRMKKGARIRALETRVDRLQKQVSTLSGLLGVALSGLQNVLDEELRRTKKRR